MDTQKKVLGLNKDCRDLPYLTGRLMGVVTHYAEKRYGPNTLGEMLKWPKRYIDIFMTYVNKKDPYLKEIAVAPLDKMDTIQQGQAWIGYYHQLAAYDRDEREKYQSITDQLRALRKQRGMTQQELAEKIGQTQQRVAEIESGQYSPSLETLKPILKALNAELLLHDLTE